LGLSLSQSVTFGDLQCWSHGASPASCWDGASIVRDLEFTYSTTSVFQAIPGLLFASAQDFNQNWLICPAVLSLLVAGFVIGNPAWWLKWFPPKEIGNWRKGIYGGLGEFRAGPFRPLPWLIVAGCFRLPARAQIGELWCSNWARRHMAITGLIAICSLRLFYFFQCCSGILHRKGLQKPA